MRRFAIASVACSVAMCASISHAADGKHCKAELVELFPLIAHAAARGDVLSALDLGVLYEHGVGIAQDNLSSAIWYGVASDAGDAWAQFRLGVLYRNGKGVTKNMEAAKKMHALASKEMWTPPNSNDGTHLNSAIWCLAEEGNAEEQFFLGLMLSLGLGIAQNDSLSIDWYEKAANQGHAGAAKNLEIKRSDSILPKRSNP